MNWLFEKTNKIDKLLTKLIKRKKSWANVVVVITRAFPNKTAMPVSR